MQLRELQRIKSEGDYDAGKELVEKYAGKAVAMLDNEVVAVAESYEQAYAIAQQKFPNKTPFVTLIPTEDEMVCLL